MSTTSGNVRLRWLFLLASLLVVFSLSSFSGVLNEDIKGSAFTTGTDQGYVAIQHKLTNGTVVSAKIISPTNRPIVSTEETVRFGGNVFSLANIWGVGVSGKTNIPDNYNKVFRVAFGCQIGRTIWSGSDHWEENHSGICVRTFSSQGGIPGKEIQLVFENKTDWTQGSYIVSWHSSYPYPGINEKRILVARNSYSPKVADIRLVLPNGNKRDETILAFNAQCEDARTGETFGACLIVTDCFRDGSIASMCDPLEVISDRTTLNGVPLNFGRMPWHWTWSTGVVPLSVRGSWDAFIINVLTPEHRVLVSLDGLLNPQFPGQQTHYVFDEKTSE